MTIDDHDACHRVTDAYSDALLRERKRTLAAISERDEAEDRAHWLGILAGVLGAISVVAVCLLGWCI